MFKDRINSLLMGLIILSEDRACDIYLLKSFMKSVNIKDKESDVYPSFLVDFFPRLLGKKSLKKTDILRSG